MPDPVTVEALVKWHRERAETITRIGSKWEKEYAKVLNPTWQDSAAFHQSSADRIERLAGALEPFADCVQDSWVGDDDEPMGLAISRDSGAELTVGDFRAARQALHPGEPNG